MAGFATPTLETRFSAALRDATLPPPADLAQAGGTPPTKRFSVYRNNVHVSLVEALGARFPAIRNAVGADYFTALARLFVTDNLPRSPVMIHYGEAFPDFIAQFPPLADHAWLGDVARLEVAFTRSYHAADALPIDPSAFAALPPERLAESRIVPHPAAALIRSAYPVVTLWGINTERLDASEPEGWTPEAALITRPGLEVMVRAIDPATADFLATALGGAPLAEALDHAAADPEFAPIPALRLLATAGLATALI
jgi:hypothetical protein